MQTGEKKETLFFSPCQLFLFYYHSLHSEEKTILRSKRLTPSFRGFRMPQTLSGITVIPSSSLVSLRAVATTSVSDRSFFPPAKLQHDYISETSNT